MTHIRLASDGMIRIGLALVAALAIGVAADRATADDYGDVTDAPYSGIAILASDHGAVEAPVSVAKRSFAVAGGPDGRRAHGPGDDDFDIGERDDPRTDPEKPRPPRIHVVTVKSDGSFVPRRTHVKSGDVVRWELSDPTDSIIPATWSGKFPAICSTPKPYDPSDPNDFTGPMIQAASGIFSISPVMLGSVVEQGGCSAGAVGAQVGNAYLCKGAGRYQETMDATWENPYLTGVFIRLLWKDVQIAPGTADSSFDFTVLDREIDKAVKHGKLYALAFKAGDDGTPEWIFSSGVTRLHLRDAGSDDDVGCGNAMDLGDPTEAAYRVHYRDLLEKVAARIKGRADWYRALAYIKPSGANLVSHENRLPKRCKEGCPVCNTRKFAENGYRPSRLYALYAGQEADLRSLFPGKTMSYALIQVGFPRVNEQGEWEVERADGSTFVGGCTPPNCHPLPGGTEQTQTVIDEGTSTWGLAFAVQHNGLGPKPSRPNPQVVEKGNASPNRLKPKTVRLTTTLGRSRATARPRRTSAR